MEEYKYSNKLDVESEDRLTGVGKDDFTYNFLMSDIADFISKLINIDIAVKITIKDLGTSSQPPADLINILPPFTTVDSEIVIFQKTDTVQGKQLYLFLLPAGTYGSGQAPITASDLLEIEREYFQITVDDALSPTSENPVQNKIIQIALNDKASLSGDNTFNGTNTFTGPVTVTGEFIRENVTDVDISDNVILVNKGEQGNGVSARYAGIQVDRGTAQDFAFIYDENRQTFTSGAFDTVDGMLQAATATTLTLDPSDTAPDDFYNNKFIKIFKANETSITANIIDYVAATKIATVQTPLTTIPDNTWNYRIVTFDETENIPNIVDYSLLNNEELLCWDDTNKIIKSCPVKLDEVEDLTSGGNADSLHSHTYTNLSQKPTIDDTLSDISTNAVQNSAIKNYVDTSIATIPTVDLSLNQESFRVTIVNSGGDDVIIPAASTTLAGVMQANDKITLNNLPTTYAAINGSANETFAAKNIVATDFSTFLGGASSSQGNETKYGYLAADSITTGISWAAFGSYAGRDNTTGDYWTAVGRNSARGNITGSFFTAFGESAAFGNTDGSRFLAIGTNAAKNLPDGVAIATSFEDSTYVGTDTKVSANGVTNENVFGYMAEGRGSNTMSFGNDDITTNYFSGDISEAGQLLSAKYAAISNVGLIKVTEGGNTGYRRADADPNNYEDIGEKAIDLSYSDEVGDVHGASGEYSFAEGLNTNAIGIHSHSEGYFTTANGPQSHAENFNTVSSGQRSHAGGESSTASGNISFVHGRNCTASALASTCFGEFTIAASQSQFVVGYNNDNKPQNIFEVGNGATADNRTNAFAVTRSGDIVASGTITEGSSLLSAKYAAIDGSATQSFSANILNSYNYAVVRSSTANEPATYIFRDRIYSANTTTADKLDLNLNFDKTIIAKDDGSLDVVKLTASDQIVTDVIKNRLSSILKFNVGTSTRMNVTTTGINVLGSVAENSVLLSDKYALKGGSSTQNFKGDSITAFGALQAIDTDGLYGVLKSDRIYSFKTGVGRGDFGLNGTKSILAKDDGELEATRLVAGTVLATSLLGANNLVTSASEMNFTVASTNSFKIKSNTINIQAIPTSVTGLVAGDVWSDSGTLKII